MLPNKQKTLWLLVTGLFVLSSCVNTQPTDNPFEQSEGRITGQVTSSSGNVENAAVYTAVNGNSYRTTTDSDGKFSIDVDDVKRGDGASLHVEHQSYETTTTSAVFELANLRVDVGSVELLTTEELRAKGGGGGPGGGGGNNTITGTILDNFTSSGLSGAVVTTQDSGGSTKSTTTDASGSFSLASKKFNTGSTYQITVSKSGYTTRNDVTVTISGSTSTINNNPVHLYREYGAIVGTLLDDTTGVALSGASVSAVDSNSSTITDITAADGTFRLDSSTFFVGSSYAVNLSKAGYQAKAVLASISIAGDNTVDGNPNNLLIDATISGLVTDDNGAPLSGAVVSTVDSDSQTISTTTAGDGSYTLDSNGFRKNAVYTINSSLNGYDSNSGTSGAIAAGDNTVSTIVLTEQVSGGPIVISGVVIDDRTSSLLSGAALSVVDDGSITRTATSAGDGSFTLSGDFTAGNSYSVSASKAAYSGSVSASAESVSVTAVAGTTDAGTIALYPVGIFSTIGGSDYAFGQNTKQTHEVFLTGKTGFTLSGLNTTNLDNASAFYVHADDASPAPATPESAKAVTLTSGAAATSGYLMESVGAFTYYRVYAATSGTLTVETTGSTDTFMYLYNGSGAQLASDDDSGAGTNARISIGVNAGWYFVKVKGYSDATYGFYEVQASGLNNGGATGNWSTADLILSWYDKAGSTMYVAGAGESGSSGSLAIDSHGTVGQTVRGSFNGTLRAVNSAGSTVSVSNGYFNIVRSE